MATLVSLHVQPHSQRADRVLRIFFTPQRPAEQSHESAAYQEARKLREGAARLRAVAVQGIDSGKVGGSSLGLTTLNRQPSIEHVTQYAGRRHARARTHEGSCNSDAPGVQYLYPNLLKIAESWLIVSLSR